MLVKLGEVWVDPDRVVTITSSYCDVVSTIRDQYQSAFFKLCSFSSEEEAGIKADEYAAIINAALINQSFGGETDEENPQVA